MADTKTCEVTADFVVQGGVAIHCKRGKGYIAYQQGQTVPKGEHAILSDAQAKQYVQFLKAPTTSKK